MDNFANGEVRPISVQGRTVGNKGIPIYGPSTGNYAAICSIKINNDRPYRFSLYKQTGVLNKKVLLYAMKMDGGDVIIDTSGYCLGTGDFLYIVVGQNAVNYSIEGLEYEKNCINIPLFSGTGLNITDMSGNPKTKCCSSSGNGYLQIAAIIEEEGTIYQNDDLKSAKDNESIKYLFIDKQIYSYIDGDFSFDKETGIITFTSITLFSGSSIIIPFET